jgi:hypothetical protein
MTAYIEFVETETIFGKTSRIRQTISISQCGKNRRDNMAKRAASRQFPKLTLNRIIAFNVCEES